MNKNSDLILNFIKENNINIRLFSKMVNVTPATIYNILKTDTIRVDTARKIHMATDGKLNIDEFDCTWPFQKKTKKKIV